MNNHSVKIKQDQETNIDDELGINFASKGREIKNQLIKFHSGSKQNNVVGVVKNELLKPKKGFPVKYKKQLHKGSEGIEEVLVITPSEESAVNVKESSSWYIVCTEAICITILSWIFISMYGSLLSIFFSDTQKAKEFKGIFICHCILATLSCVICFIVSKRSHIMITIIGSICILLATIAAEIIFTIQGKSAIFLVYDFIKTLFNDLI